MQKELLARIKRLFPAPEWHMPEDPHDYLYEFGSAKEALLYAFLYLPHFIEIDGSILYDQADKETPKNFKEAKSENKLPLSETEDNFNYVETSYIFRHSSTKNITEEDDLFFAECIAEAWRGRLNLLYPNRHFEVRVIKPPESGDAYGVSFHELR